MERLEKKASAGTGRRQLSRHPMNVPRATKVAGLLVIPYRNTAAGLQGCYSLVDGCNAVEGSRQLSRVTLEDAMAPSSVLR